MLFGRAECKRTAFEYATQLMRNETRDKIDKKYRKKIELIARRPSTDEKDEKLSPCPYCDFKIPETLLDCPACKNSIPYCATTGKHMVRSAASEIESESGGYMPSAKPSN